MGMLDALGSPLRKLIYSPLDAVPASLHQITHNEVARSVEAVVAVNTDVPLPSPALLFCPRLLLLPYSIHEGYEGIDFIVSGRDLRHRGEFVVPHAAPF